GRRLAHSLAHRPRHPHGTHAQHHHPARDLRPRGLPLRAARRLPSVLRARLPARTGPGPTDHTAPGDPMTHTTSTPVGLVSLDPLTLDDATVSTLHAWLTHPRSTYWGLTGASRPQVADFLRGWDAGPHRQLFL